MNADLTEGQYERKPTPGTLSPWVEGLQANADATIEELRHLTEFDFGYNRESVEWLEGYIERMKDAGIFNGRGRDKLISVFGSFLGECVVRCYSGTWKKRNGSWSIVFDDENTVLPFLAIAMQVEHGPACGIRSFFDMLPIRFIGCIRPKSQPQKQPWAFWRKAG